MVDRLAGKRPFVVGGNAGSAAQAAMEERRQTTMLYDMTMWADR
jgi:hypothetical protein